MPAGRHVQGIEASGRTVAGSSPTIDMFTGQRLEFTGDELHVHPKQAEGLGDFLRKNGFENTVSRGGIGFNDIQMFVIRFGGDADLDAIQRLLDEIEAAVRFVDIEQVPHVEIDGEVAVFETAWQQELRNAASRQEAVEHLRTSILPQLHRQSKTLVSRNLADVARAARLT